MSKVKFEADPSWVVKAAVNYYISFLEVNKEDKSKLRALKKTNLDLESSKAEKMIEKLLEKKGKDYFILSNMIDDGRFFTKLIEETETYKRDLYTNKIDGVSGNGIFDKTGGQFTKCEEGHHRVALISILKHTYPDYYDKYEEFLELSSTNVKELDDFIKDNFIFV